MSSKKILIMPNPEERERLDERSDSLGSAQATGKGEAPLRASAFRDLAAVIDIFRTLGGVNLLEATTKSHTEKIEQLTESVSTIPRLERDVAQNTKDLNELAKELNGLGQRLDRKISDLRANEIGDLKGIVGTARVLGYVALTLAGVIGAAIAGYLFRK